jgi:ABC-2 type transport system permease protein
MMAAYVELIRIRFLMMLAYRVNYYSGIAVYAINIGAYHFVWKAVYDAGIAIVGGFDGRQMTTYIAIAWMARAFYFNNVDRDIATDIRDGSVAIALVRPLSYLAAKMMQALGEGMFRLVFFSVPGLFIVGLIVSLQWPSEWWRWFVFLPMVFFGFVLNTQLNVIVGLGAFFLEHNEGLMRFKRVSVDVLSGLIVPLTVFPLAVQPILAALPFQAITYLPTAVVTERISGWAIGGAIGNQLFWIAVCTVPIVVLWRIAKRRLVVQGG